MTLEIVPKEAERLLTWPGLLAAFEAGQSFVAAIGDATSTTNAQLREAFDAAPQRQAD